MKSIVRMSGRTYICRSNNDVTQPTGCRTPDCSATGLRVEAEASKKEWSHEAFYGLRKGELYPITPDF